jgi:diaminopimelate decarboxylase
VGASVLTTASAFPRVDGALWCESVPLARIADAIGTPVYVYSAGAVRAQYAALDAALEPIPHRIHYSVKANGNLALLRLVRSLGAGVDIVSGGELDRARRAGFGGSDILFGGVGKTARELREALDAGVLLINVESEAEAELLSGIAVRAGVTAPVALRINPEVMVDTPHPYTRTGERGMRFGIPVDDALAVAQRVHRLPGIRLVGLDAHIGSQITGVDPYERATVRLVELVQALRAAGAGGDLRYLDVGGGLAVSYGDAEATDVGTFARTLIDPIGPTGLTLLVEPGRYLVANAGVLLTRVLYRKRSGGKTHVITDAGMTDLLRPSHYHSYHRIEPVMLNPGERPESVDVSGPVCESGDFFALDRAIPPVAPGDLLAIHSTGAYGFVMASNYNARPRPPEVLVDGSRHALVREREGYDDLVRHELQDPTWVDA